MRFADDVSNLSGTADVSSFTVTAALPAANSPSSPSLAGSFSAASSGRFPLTRTVAPASGRPAPEFTTSNPACCIVDTNTPISWSGRHHTPQRCHATAEERPLRNDTLVRSAIALSGTALTACALLRHPSGESGGRDAASSRPTGQSRQFTIIFGG